MSYYVMESDPGTNRIQVFVRVRPSEDGQCCFSVNSGRQIVFTGQNQKFFEFDHVADQDTTQVSFVLDSLTTPIIDKSQIT